MRAHPLPRWDIRGGPKVTGTPSRSNAQGSSNYHAANFDGVDAPWALSALPECLIQQSSFHGRDLAAVLTHLPKRAQSVAAGTTLRYRSCYLEVRARDARVRRGIDRFHIPPLSHVYLAPGKLILARQTTNGRGAELRIYITSNL